MRRTENGTGIFELLAALVIIMLILASAVPGVTSFFSRIDINSTVSVVTSSMSMARYLSLSSGRKVKLKISGGKIDLMQIKNKKWMPFKTRPLPGSSTVRMNAYPVFSPTGSVSPLCSATVSNGRYIYTITISFAGRIKVKKTGA